MFILPYFELNNYILIRLRLKKSQLRDMMEKHYNLYQDINILDINTIVGTKI